MFPFTINQTLPLLSKICPDDHLYIPLTFKLRKLGMTTIFLLSLLLCGSRIPKKHIFFQTEISLLQASKQKETYFATSNIF